MDYPQIAMTFNKLFRFFEWLKTFKQFQAVKNVSRGTKPMPLQSHLRQLGHKSTCVNILPSAFPVDNLALGQPTQIYNAPDSVLIMTLNHFTVQYVYTVILTVNTKKGLKQIGMLRMLQEGGGRFYTYQALHEIIYLPQFRIENQRYDLSFDLVQESLGFSPLFKAYLFCLRLLSLSLSIVRFSLAFFNLSILNSDRRNC